MLLVKNFLPAMVLRRPHNAPQIQAVLQMRDGNQKPN